MARGNNFSGTTSGQVGGMSGSVEVMVSLEGGGQFDGLLHGGDDGHRDDQAGGEGVPEIMVSGGDKHQTEKFETVNICKSDWDAIDKGDVTGLLVDEPGGGGGQRERRRRSEEFQNRLDMFEELGMKKNDELLGVINLDASQDF